MATYLCVKTGAGGADVKKYQAHLSANLPYLRVEDGYFPLTTQTNASGLKVKGQSGSIYLIAEKTTSVTTTSQTTTESYLTEPVETVSQSSSDATIPIYTFEHRITNSRSSVNKSRVYYTMTHAASVRWVSTNTFIPTSLSNISIELAVTRTSYGFTSGIATRYFTSSTWSRNSVMSVPNSKTSSSIQTSSYAFNSTIGTNYQGSFTRYIETKVSMFASATFSLTDQGTYSYLVSSDCTRSIQVTDTLLTYSTTSNGNGLATYTKSGTLYLTYSYTDNMISTSAETTGTTTCYTTVETTVSSTTT